MLGRAVVTRFAAASKGSAHPYHHIRNIHASVVCHHMLVGPPDGVSHLRPIVYDNLSLHSQNQHPYSLSEFRNTEADSLENEDDYGNYELKLRSTQLDSFNHQYWTEANTRFEQLKEATLSTLPTSASPEDKEEALSHFYKSWYTNEARQQQVYSSKLRAQTRDNMVLAARAWYRSWRARLGIA